MGDVSSLSAKSCKRDPARTGSGRMHVTNLFLFLLKLPAGAKEARPKLQMSGLKQIDGEERAAGRKKYQQMLFDNIMYVGKATVSEHEQKGLK